MKFEYDYIGLGDEDLMTPSSITETLGGDSSPVGSRVANVSQNQQMVKVGLNYRLGGDPHAATFLDGTQGTVQRYTLPPGWMFQPALRYWYSVGRFQKDLPNGGSPASNSLISRLTYDDVTANSGEFYGRLDTPWRVFLKGIVGSGRTTGGDMNDEDWALLDDNPSPDDDRIAYSNTISGLSGKNMRYAAVDGGYDILRGPDYRAGLFLGWAHAYEKYPDNGCYQIASSSPESSCYRGNIDVTPAVTETDTWDALRLGAAADIWLTPYLQLTADAAYLPRVWFDGRDDHAARGILIKEHGTGQGAQLELLLSYYLTQDFSVGVGGRYWAMWTSNGNDIFGGEETHRSDTYRYERAGVFLQGAYTFDFCCAASAALK